jgi:predicted transcriptional regulator
MMLFDILSIIYQISHILSKKINFKKIFKKFNMNSKTLTKYVILIIISFNKNIIYLLKKIKK